MSSYSRPERIPPALTLSQAELALLLRDFRAARRDLDARVMKIEHAHGDRLDRLERQLEELIDAQRLIQGHHEKLLQHLLTVGVPSLKRRRKRA